MACVHAFQGTLYTVPTVLLEQLRLRVGAAVGLAVEHGCLIIDWTMGVMILLKCK